MAMSKKTPKNIDDYVDRFPKEVRQLLEKMRDYGSTETE